MGLRYGYLTLILTFLLGCHEGFVALWNSGQTQPVMVFPYQVRSLPSHDRQQLEAGIPAESREELMRLLEDYLS